MSNLGGDIAQCPVSLPEIKLWQQQSKKHAKVDIKLFLPCPFLLDFSVLFQIFCPRLQVNGRQNRELIILFTSGKKGSVITAFYGIRWGHHVMGFDSATDNSFVQLAFKGCQCLCQRLCQLETTKKEPITSEKIKSLINKFGGKHASISDLRFFRTCFLDFSEFLHIDKLLSAQIKHLKITSHIRKSGTKIKNLSTQTKAYCFHFTSFIRMLSG